MSTERRTVRPFVGLDAIDDILRSTCLLRVGPDRLESGESIVLTHEGFLGRQVVLELGQEEEVFVALQVGLRSKLESIGLEPAVVDLVVIASSPYLKVSDVVARRPLVELRAIGRELILSDPRPRALRSPRSGCQVDVYLVLNRNLAPQPLRPRRKGTWLAHCTFGLSSELAPVGFSPLPLTADKRRDLGNLPADTLRYIVFEDDESPLEPGSSESSLSMYVDEEVLAKLAAASKSPASEAFQMQLFVDAVAEILRESRNDPRFASVSLDDLDDTLLGRVLDGLSRRPGQTLEQRRHTSETLLQHARHDPNKFLAFVEAVVGLRKKLNEVLDQ